MDNPENKTPDTYPEDYSNENVHADASDTSGSVRKKSLKKRILLLTLIPSSLLIILLTLFLCLPFFLPAETIAANVWIGNVNIGNMTRTEACNAIKAQYKPGNVNFSVYADSDGSKKTLSFTTTDIAYTANPYLSLDEAYKIGRSDNHLKNSYDVLISFFTKREVEPVYQCDRAMVESLFKNFALEIFGAYQEETFTLSDNTLSVTPENPGPKEDVSKAVSEFIKSFEKGKYTNIPVTLECNDITPVTFDEIYSKIYIAPLNSTYQVSNNKVTVTEAVPGRDADPEQINALVEQVNNGKKSELSLFPVPAEYTKEMLEKSLFNSTLATCSSNYKTSSQNRAYNVELAASKINGLIVADGEEFSYNKIIGNASLENGYKTSTVYSGGKVIEGVGGGVCQISSTLYGAVLRTGLEVTRRQNHSLPVSYLPRGEDATVAYDYLDFRFKNNTGAPIKIITNCVDRTVTISIIGSDHAYRYVEVTSEEIEVIPPETVTLEDPTLPVGQTKTITQGTSGGVYMTYRKIYNPDGTLSEEKKIKSTYKPIATEIAVGTMPTE